LSADSRGLGKIELAAQSMEGNGLRCRHSA